MAPEIVDLTSDLDEDDSLDQSQRRPPQLHESKSQTREIFKPPLPSPAKDEPATPKRSLRPSLLSPRSARLTSPCTPSQKTPSLSWDDTIPLSLRKDSEGIHKHDSIDPLLRSPLFKLHGAHDSGLGESMSGSERSTQDYTSLEGAAARFVEYHPDTEGAGRKSPDEGASAVRALSQDQLYDDKVIPEVSVDELANYPSTNSKAGNKRKRSNEPATESEITSRPLLSALPREQSDMVSIIRSASPPQIFSNDMPTPRITSITPHIPGLRKSATRSQDDKSPYLSNSDANTSQERAPTSLTIQEKEPSPGLKGTLGSNIPSSSSIIGPKPAQLSSPEIPMNEAPSIEATHPSAFSISANNKATCSDEQYRLNASDKVQPLPAPSLLAENRARNFEAPLTQTSHMRQGAPLRRAGSPLHESAFLQNNEKLHVSQRMDMQKRAELTLSSPTETSHNRSSEAWEIPMHHSSSSEGEVEMRFDARNGDSFPQGFDRGRFPMKRRRRGGAKYGTPRINGFPKLQKMSGSPGDRPHTRQEPKLSAGVPPLTIDTVDAQRKAEEAPSPLTSSNSKQIFFQLYRTSGSQVGANLSELETSQPVQSHHSRSQASFRPTSPTVVSINPSQGNLAWSAEDNDRVTKFFFAVLGPAIRRLKKHFLDQLSNAELDGVAKRVSVHLVTNDLLDFLRKNDFSTDKPQRKKIRKRIGSLYYHEISTALQIRKGQARSPNDRKVEMPWATIPPKSTSAADPSIRNYDCPTAEPFHGLKSSQGTTSMLFNDGFNAQAANIRHKLPIHRSRNGRFSRPAPHSTKGDFEGTPVRIRNPLSPLVAASPALHQIVPQVQPAAPEMYTVSEGPSESMKESGERGREPVPSALDDLGKHWPNLNFKKLAKAPAESPSVPIRGHSTRTYPGTLFDPQLENIIAEAISMPPSCNDDGSSHLHITRTDQAELLEHDYILKSVSRELLRVNAIQTRVVDPTVRPERQIPALLRSRELGLNHRTRVRSELRLRNAERLRPWRKWKGASSDVVSVVWAPDSLKYAVGAAAHTNAEDLQYNRPCNLMLGELESNLLWELPDHRTKRPPPSTIAQGYNSMQETYNACDPMVYQTINAISFSPYGDHMYTASRDHTVKVWDTHNGKKTCVHTLEHGSVVAGVDVSHGSNMNVFATACQSIEDSIRVYYGSDSNGLSSMVFSSSRAKWKPNLKILPECIRWGPTSQNHHLLLAGFSQWDEFGPAGIAKEGQLCLWDMSAFKDLKVTPSSQSVTTLTWHPFMPFFATGGAPGSGDLSRGTKTVVRTYDQRTLTRFAMEYESPARDIQDITFHPLDTNIVTAGCTDGTSFIWDYRWPDKPLHRLWHGDALMELDHSKPRDEVDTGVLLSLWGPDGSLYYSGSSDGIVKAWDIRRHPADVHVRNVAHVGAAIQDGAFSPDFSHLLVGDADGAIHVLSSAPVRPHDDDDSDDSDDDRLTESPIQLIRAADGSGKRLDLNDDNPGTEGIESAKQLLASGQLEMHPTYGPGKGSQYRGPYANDERRTMNQDGSLRSLSEDVEKLQVYDRSDHLNVTQAAFRRAYTDRRKWEFEARKPKTAKPPNSSAVNPSRADIQMGRPRVQESCIQRSEETPNGKARESMMRARRAEKEGMKGAIDNTIPEAKLMEEDFWWPRMGEEEILRALAKG